MIRPRIAPTARRLPVGSLLAIGAAVLAPIHLGLSRLDGDGDLDPFFAIVVVVAVVIAVAVSRAPTSRPARISKTTTH